jgi:hypothetical protein
LGIKGHSPSVPAIVARYDAQAFSRLDIPPSQPVVIASGDKIATLRMKRQTQ